MAEIKVLKGERTTVGPVGIVQMGTGGIRAARQMQEAGKRLFEEGTLSLLQTNAWQAFV